jgi:hypothetical protein
LWDRAPPRLPFFKTFNFKITFENGYSFFETPLP